MSQMAGPRQAPLATTLQPAAIFGHRGHGGEYLSSAILLAARQDSSLHLGRRQSETAGGYLRSFPFGHFRLLDSLDAALSPLMASAVSGAPARRTLGALTWLLVLH